MNWMQTSYRAMSLIIFMTAVLLFSGCSHRSVHGSKHVDKPRITNVKNVGEGSLSSLDELARVGEGAFSDSNSLASQSPDLFSQEEVEDGGSLIKELSPAERAGQYWRERQDAQFVTDQSGIQDVFFELDSWELTEQAKRVLAANATVLKSSPQNMVTIEGHCDERGTRAYNYVLGEKRAKRTRNYLASLGVSQGQMMVMSYGKDHPLCRGTSNSCFMQNRRAHFLLGIRVAQVDFSNPTEDQN